MKVTSTVPDTAIQQAEPGSGGADERGATPEPTRWRRWVRRVPADGWACLAYLIGGLWLTIHLWVEIRSRVLNSFPPDQYLFEFWLSHSARVFTHGENPFFTTQINYPFGVNVMANTAMFGMTIPLVPVTLLFGPKVSFALMVTLAPALTALGWYLLFSRRVVRSRLAAAVAGAFCGFAPGIVAQDNVHPNLAMQLPIPLIIWQLLRMRDKGTRPWQPGLFLGLLVTYQFFINEEILLITAIGSGLFVATWAWYHRAEARERFRPFVGALGIAAIVALVLLAYPMYFQFAGPQSYHGFGWFARLFGTDLASWTAFPTHSLASGPDSVRIASNVVEETTFFGWPLVIMTVVWVAMLWRRPVVRAALVPAVLFGIGSLGSHIHFAGQTKHIPGPWLPLTHVPLLDSMIPSRLPLALLPVLGLLIALVVDDLVALPRDRVGRGLRLLGYAGVALALVPVIPTPFSVTSRGPVPPFITQGTWRSYVTPGHGLLLLPVPTGITGISATQWTAATLGDIPVVGGYFVGPDPDRADHAASFGPAPRPTLKIFYDIASIGRAPTVTSVDRDSARADLRYWRASVVVLHPKEPHASIMRDTMTQLVGYPPQLVGGVWLWDVRSLTS